MEMQAICVANINQMDKTIAQCKSGKLLGMFGNMTIREMAYNGHGHRLKRGNQNITHWPTFLKSSLK